LSERRRRRTLPKTVPDLLRTLLGTGPGRVNLQIVDAVGMDALDLIAGDADLSVTALPFPTLKHLEWAANTDEERKRGS
jgi:hypothetical protein